MEEVLLERERRRKKEKSLRIERIVQMLRTQTYMRRLKRDQWRRLNELRGIQLKKFRTIVKYAYEYVPYWRRLLSRAKVRPEDIRCQKDIEKIPTTSRFDVQKNPRDFFAKGIDISLQNASLTTGSTGIPLKILIDKAALVCYDALDQYKFSETGVSLRDKFATIWGHSDSINWEKRHSILSGHFRNTTIPVSSPNIVVRALKQVKPDAILAFPSTLTSLCAEDLSGIAPRRIYTQAETVSGHCRKLVRQAFGLEVFDTYGSVEFDSLAFECEKHCGLHMLTGSSMIEFVDARGEHVASGERGETIVTGLLNYAMPLIRYELGDLGIPTDEKCACGRTWPLIKSIEGRTNDCIVLPSGKTTYSMNFYHIYHREFERNMLLISQYQLVQERRDRILFKVVKGKRFDPEALERIKTNLEAYFAEQGEKVEIVPQVVDEIPEERTGKKRVVVSMLR